MTIQNHIFFIKTRKDDDMMIGILRSRKSSLIPNTKYFDLQDFLSLQTDLCASQDIGPYLSVLQRRVAKTDIGYRLHQYDGERRNPADL